MTTQFDTNLIELAEAYYREAVCWAEEDGTSQAATDLAKESDMTIDELSRINLSHAVTKLLRICDLTSYDTELSDEVRGTLQRIEKDVKTLKRKNTDATLEE